MVNMFQSPATAQLATRVRGLSLVEILAVLALVAILSAVALPTYRGYALRAQRTAAQADLMRCAQGMERHAIRTGSYAAAADSDSDGTPDSDTGPPAANICVAETDTYTLAIVAADGRRFLLQASPVIATGDGALAIDSTGARSWDRNDDGDFDDQDEASWHW